MIIGMARTTLRARGQLTLPEEIRRAAHLEEGDLLDAEITSDGILLRPQKIIDSTQAWFWEPTWQAGERAADSDRAAGRVETFDSGEALIEELRSIARPSARRRTR
jgi:AbrB family looped-hinge helix DNA binding protein